MRPQRFDPKYDSLVAAVASDFNQGEPDRELSILDPSADVRLKNFRPEDLEHNIRFIRERAQHDGLMRKIIEEYLGRMRDAVTGDWSYYREKDAVFPFYAVDYEKQEGHATQAEIPPGYETRLAELVEDLNGLRLAQEEELKKGDKSVKALLKPLSPREIRALRKKNAERIAGRSEFASFALSNTVMRGFRRAYAHLYARAYRADRFLERLFDLYAHIDESLRETR